MTWSRSTPIRSCPITTFRGSTRSKVKTRPHMLLAIAAAFVATGSFTRDKKIVMGHNAWTNYVVGTRWNIIFDIKATKGARILMDGLPGVIASDDDFGVNSAGIMVTETTITQFEGWDPAGKPEFVLRVRPSSTVAQSTTSSVSCSKATMAAMRTTG